MHVLAENVIIRNTKKNMLNMFSKHDISTHKHSTYGICAVHFGLNFIVNIWVFPKIGLPPNHPF